MTHLARIANALSDGNRLQILLALEGGELCLCQLTAFLELAPSTTSRHLLVLERAGLLRKRQEGQWHYFRLADAQDAPAAQHAVAWLLAHADDDPELRRAVHSREEILRLVDAPSVCVRPRRVLFLCSHNSCRSRMAEALLNQAGGGRFHAESAGLEPLPIHPLTRRALKEIGLNLVWKKSRMATEIAGRARFDYLITVCSSAEQRAGVFPEVGTRLHWPFADPAAVTGTEFTRLLAFRAVRDQIAARIENWLRAPNP